MSELDEHHQGESDPFSWTEREGELARKARGNRGERERGPRGGWLGT